MINFIQLCNFMTRNGRYKYFFFPKEYLSSLTPEELSTVTVNETRMHDTVELWFPKETYDNRPLSKEGLQLEMNKALEAEKFALVNKLGKRIKNGEYYT